MLKQIKEWKGATEPLGGGEGGGDLTRADHLPSVGVSVAIDMAASRAARRRTLKNILIHCHNLTQTDRRQE